MTHPVEYLLKENGEFPNSVLPVLHYKKILKLPSLFPAAYIKKLFTSNNWTNNWRSGIYTYHHYHSITHEAMGVCHGSTIIRLGGDNNTIIMIEKGDVIIIPAGVAHKNMGREKDVICIGGYPEGRDFDMNYGRPGERPHADHNIKSLPLPSTDPVQGTEGGLVNIWKSSLTVLRN